MRSVITILIFALAFSLVGCKMNQSSRSSGEQQNETVMQRAVSEVPVPRVNNFLTRKSVAKWMRRMDKPNKIFYVYIMADTGQSIGYYTAQNRPVSMCDLMTPPDRVHNGYDNDGNTVVQAPSLDGVYHGHGCNGVYFFSASTDAYIEIDGFHYIVTDQPLDIKAKPIQVQKTN